MVVVVVVVVVVVGGGVGVVEADVDVVEVVDVAAAAAAAVSRWDFKWIVNDVKQRRHIVVNYIAVTASCLMRKVRMRCP